MPYPSNRSFFFSPCWAAPCFRSYLQGTEATTWESLDRRQSRDLHFGLFLITTEGENGKTEALSAALWQTSRTVHAHGRRRRPGDNGNLQTSFRLTRGRRGAAFPERPGCSCDLCLVSFWRARARAPAAVNGRVCAGSPCRPLAEGREVSQFQRRKGMKRGLYAPLNELIRQPDKPTQSCVSEAF